MDQYFRSSNEPKYPKFQDYEIRYSTFAAWNNPKNPHDLVKSGFSFIGGKDNVQCFYCGIILNNWTRVDDVDFCHRNSSPNCKYIKSKQYEINSSTIDLFSDILLQLRDLRAKVYEIQELIETKVSSNTDYKLFEGIQFPKF